MYTNKTKRLAIADEGKWLTLDNVIFVKSLYLAKSLTFEEVIEVTDAYKVQRELELELLNQQEIIEPEIIE